MLQQKNPKKFVAFRLTATQTLSRQASKILKNCNDCHSNQDTNTMIQNIDLSYFPYPNTTLSSQALLTKIKSALDLDHSGANAAMPPPDSEWRPNKDQIQTLQNWFKLGAPDFSGHPQISSSTAQGGNT